MKPFIMKFPKLLFLLGLLLTLESCKPKNASGLKNDGNCGCSDLECWDNFTNKGVSRSLQCAKTAGLTLVGVAGLKLLESLKGYYDLASLAYEEEFVGVFKALAGDEKYYQKFKEHPKFKCFVNSGSIIQKMINLIEFAMTLSPNMGPEAAVGAIKASYDSVLGAIKFGEVATSCINGSSPMDESLKKFVDGVKKIGVGLAVLNVLRECQFIFADIAGGANNYQCLVQDWENLAAAEERLSRAHQTRVEGDPENNTDPSLCNDEPLSCNYYAAGHWGSYLYNQGDGYFETRSYFCANMCGNSAEGRQACNSVRDQVFRGFSQCAVAACDTTQCPNALSACVSYCCRQDGSCVRDAEQKLGSYGFNKGSEDAQPKYTVSFPGSPFSGGAVTGEGLNCNRTTAFQCEGRFNAGSYLTFSMPTTITADGKTYTYTGQITCNGQTISKQASGGSVEFYIENLNRDFSCSFNFR